MENWYFSGDIHHGQAMICPCSGNLFQLSKHEMARKWKAGCQQGNKYCNLVGLFFFSSNILIPCLFPHFESIFSWIKAFTFCIDSNNLYVLLKDTIYFNNWKNMLGQCRKEMKLILFNSNFSYLFFSVLYASQLEAE